MIKKGLLQNLRFTTAPTKFVLRTNEIRLWRVKSPLWDGYGVPAGQIEYFWGVAKEFRNTPFYFIQQRCGYITSSNTSAKARKKPPQISI